MRRGVLAALVFLAAAGTLSAQEDVLKYGDSVGFFGQGRANRHYEYRCPYCHQDFWIPTGSYSEASTWVSIHKKGHGAGGGAAGPAGGGSSLEETATRAIVEGIKHRDGQLVMMGAGAHLLNGLMNSLFSDLGSNSATLEREREFRAAEERRRLEEIARREEMERMARIARAAGFREDWDRRDAEMIQALDGVFDVVRSPKSTPFFGQPANPTAAPAPIAVQPAPVAPAPAPLPPAPIYPSDVVVLGSDSLSVNPAFLGQGVVRAAETRTYVDGLSRWDIAPDPRTTPDRPRLDALMKLGGLMVDDVKDAVVEGLEVPGLAQARSTYNAVTDFADDLFKKLGSTDFSDPGAVKQWESASEQMGRDLLRDAWGDPSRRHEKYSEVFDQLWTGVRR